MEKLGYGNPPLESRLKKKDKSKKKNVNRKLLEELPGIHSINSRKFFHLLFFDHVTFEDIFRASVVASEGLFFCFVFFEKLIGV